MRDFALDGVDALSLFCVYRKSPESTPQMLRSNENTTGSMFSAEFPGLKSKCTTIESEGLTANNRSDDDDLLLDEDEQDEDEEDEEEDEEEEEEHDSDDEVDQQIGRR